MPMMTYKVIRIIPMGTSQPIRQQVGEHFTEQKAHEQVNQLKDLELGVKCHYLIEYN